MARIEVPMPQMGESIAEGTVSRWLKQLGETVKRDEPLLEISTDKVDAEIPSPSEGVLVEILVQEGETVEVGTIVAYVDPEASAGEGASPPPGPGRRPGLRTAPPLKPLLGPLPKPHPPRLLRLQLTTLRTLMKRRHRILPPSRRRMPALPARSRPNPRRGGSPLRSASGLVPLRWFGRSRKSTE